MQRSIVQRQKLGVFRDDAPATNPNKQRVFVSVERGILVHSSCVKVHVIHFLSEESSRVLRFTLNA
jgi:hypothetical protein